MGYRSDVTAIIYGPEDQLDALIAKHELLGSSPMQHFAKNLRRGKFPPDVDGTQDSVLEMRGEGWKWYESYPDVCSWMEFMRDAEASFDDLKYEFVRIGENDGDVERESSANIVETLLYVRTEVREEYEIIAENTQPTDGETA